MADERFRFYLGVHNSSWLHTRPIDRSVPLFLSRNRMPKGGRDRKTFKRATTDWALDSGAFTELKDYGKWRMTAEDYARLVNRYDRLIGRLAWVSPQDWMCEPIVIKGGRSKDGVFVGTKLSVREHQIRTVENFIRLQGLCVPQVIPVLQGFTMDEYLDCYDLYERSGVDLTQYDTVGVGSVCRRQGDPEIAAIFKLLSEMGVSCHGFGVKTSGLTLAVDYLKSADSLAWSLDAFYKKTAIKGTSCGKLKRNGEPIKNCANCFHAAVEWYDELLLKLQYQNRVINC